jgi:hypothetical protein
MRDSTFVQLRAIAPSLLHSKPNPCPVVVQRAIAILEILEDGKWHTASAIASQIGVKPKYVCDILRACKDGWGLASSTRRGWMLVKTESVIIV